MHPEIKRVAGIIAQEFDVSERDLLSRIRTQKIARARAGLYYACQQIPGFSQFQIERNLNRASGTMKQGLRSHYRWIATDKDYVARIQCIVNRLDPRSNLTSTIVWKLTKESPPKELNPVLILTPDHDEAWAGYAKDGLWYALDGESLINPVTHWAEFPTRKTQ